MASALLLVLAGVYTLLLGSLGWVDALELVALAGVGLGSLLLWLRHEWSGWRRAGVGLVWVGSLAAIRTILLPWVVLKLERGSWSLFWASLALYALFAGVFVVMSLLSAQAWSRWVRPGLGRHG